MRVSAGVVLAALFAGCWCSAQTTNETSLQPRTSKGAECAVAVGDYTAWQTPAEKTCYATTPDYTETMAYLKPIPAAAPESVRIEPFGRSGEGRELDIVIVSRGGAFDPAAIHAAERPIVLVQN